MKKAVLLFVFILGITPNFNENFIGLLSCAYSQSMGDEWWEDAECDSDETWCMGCNSCYDSYDGNCPSCTDSKWCDKCCNYYDIDDKHDCQGYSSDYPYSCSYCTDRFADEKSLSNHMRRVHYW